MPEATEAPLSLVRSQRTEVDVSGLDYASMSAHKLYGPKGIGALFYSETPPEPGQMGGGHESGLRAGTLNVSGIVGFGAACAIALEEREPGFQLATELRSIVLEGLQDVPYVQVNGGPDAVPHILSLSFEGVQGETLVVEADAAGYAVSSGAACSSRSTEPSRVLTALGLPDALLRGTIRISFGRYNTHEAAAGLARSLREIVMRLRRAG